MSSAALEPGDAATNLMVRLMRQLEDNGYWFTRESCTTFSLWCMCQYVNDLDNASASKTRKKSLLDHIIDLADDPVQNESTTYMESDWVQCTITNAHKRLHGELIDEMRNEEHSWLDMAKIALRFSLRYLMVLREDRAHPFKEEGMIDMLRHDIVTNGNMYGKYAQFNTEMLAIGWRKGMDMLLSVYRGMLESYTHEDDFAELLVLIILRTLATEIRMVLDNIWRHIAYIKGKKGYATRTKNLAKSTIYLLKERISDALANNERLAILQFDWKEMLDQTSSWKSSELYTKMLWIVFPSHLLKLRCLLAQICELIPNYRLTSATYLWRSIGMDFFQKQRYKRACQYFRRACYPAVILGRQIGKTGSKSEELLKQCYKAMEVDESSQSKDYSLPTDPVPFIVPGYKMPPVASS